MDINTTLSLLNLDTSRSGSEPVGGHTLASLRHLYPELNRLFDRLEWLEEGVEQYGDPQELSEAIDKLRQLT